MDFDRVSAAKRNAESEFLKRPGVVGVGVGWKYVGGRRTNELAIRVYVTDKRDVPPPERIPPQFAGVLTDVIQRRIKPMVLAAPVPQVAASVDASSYDPLVGGISIGSCREIGGNAFSGTLGCPVVDRQTDDPMVLSNYHVLALDQMFAVGDQIVQPSVPDAGACPDDVIGTLQRAVLGGQIDAAVASATNRETRCEIVEIGAIGGTGVADIGMEVRKRGRTSRVTSGTIDALDVAISVVFEGIGPVMFSNQIEITSGARSIAVEEGLFIAGEWTNAPSSSSGDVTVEMNAQGITVTGPNGSLTHLGAANTTLRYMIYGNDHVLILDTLGSIGPITRRVTSVDFTTVPPSERMILTAGSSGPNIPAPVVQFSQGDGSVFLIYSSSGTQLQNLAMYESRTGEAIFAGPPSFMATGETRGEATQDSLIIHYSINGVSNEAIFQFANLAEGDPFLLPGDSGAVAVDNSRRVIGLLFAGNEEERDENGTIVLAEGVFAYANHIEPVLETLEVDLCRSAPGGGATIPGGGGGLPPPPPHDWKLSLRNIAADKLGIVPEFSVRFDVLADSSAQNASLRSRLVDLLVA
ncbi:hypothetical protein [uncultured Roseobacter sp.]|uniref:hypothetical protein n=1 Tax=uncultured Roseobacter sp. TaxID=114847 RepID=UPI00261AF234|nr:hypothetical protein [uncultured Roseobacter sp.]